MLWKPLVICPDETLHQALLTALAEWRGVGARQYPQPAAALELAYRHQANVCFLDGVSQPDASHALIGPLAEAGVPVVLLFHQEDSAAILRGLRLGAAEFLFPPFGPAETGVLLGRMAGRSGGATPTASHRLYACLPGKGSCGCTTMLVHLASQVAARVRGRVLLADFDVLTGSVAFHLNLKPSFTVADAFVEPERLDEEKWARMVANVRGVEVLAAPEEPTPIPPVAAVEALLDFWKRRYAVALLDCPLWGGTMTAAVARRADRVLVVTTNEIAALHGTRRTLAALERAGVETDKTSLVVSRCTNESGLDRSAIEQALRRSVFALLPNDFAGVQQRLLEASAMAPASRFGKELAQLAARLSDASPQPPARTGGMFSGFLKKKFA